MVTLQCGNTRFEGIEAILFDKDGTLADSQHYLRHLAQKRARLIDAQVPGVYEPLLMAFGIDGYQCNNAGLMAVGSRQENEIAAAAYVAETGYKWLDALDLVQQAFQEADRYLLHKKAEQTPLFPGTETTLSTLASSLSLGILSADSTENVRDFVEFYELPILHYQGSEPNGLRKPNPDMVHQACQALATTASHTLVIGDSSVDSRMARQSLAAGFVAVVWRQSGWEQPEADAHLDDWQQLQIVSD
ncbi:HAD family hydrolase [Halomicronema hongdechloris C2206]|uniref:HAD family hydrolase n=1 Tax=Halomicronema hongdechloris C2206 TaxID=1641165 RepID=A0A1Z3HH84_9CYAN|nr:HAD-IA family hydrolase [Halomicronema hongdechloris]ASC69682.1 HAD family hydrolase [Halomicronema hongdechloris C2206]